MLFLYPQQLWCYILFILSLHELTILLGLMYGSNMFPHIFLDKMVWCVCVGGWMRWYGVILFRSIYPCAGMCGCVRQYSYLFKKIVMFYFFNLKSTFVVFSFTAFILFPSI